jgi:pyrroloquinoline quinone biosynthesis protein B
MTSFTHFFNRLALTACMLGLFCTGCTSTEEPPSTPSGPYLMVLGIAQDAGYPQAGCRKSCCKLVGEGREQPRLVNALGIVDPETDQIWMLEASPDFPKQLALLSQELPARTSSEPDGIFLTHAHIGHYTGLMHLGREAMGAREVPVYAMPRMDTFLRTNGPWSQLVRLRNMDIRSLSPGEPVRLNHQLSVRPLPVPHRDEFSETVGFIIEGPQRKILFIPDIDKWERWTTDINALLQEVDAALLDGTFFENDELPNRDMSEIPHPFVVESMERFGDLPVKEKQKIIFTHFNHTNPLLREGKERKQVEKEGYRVAREGMRLPL